MASKYQLVTDLYLQTTQEIASPEIWPQFLKTACYNFRLSFDKQILLYAQRPEATAILPINGPHGWNRRFGRWVNRGAKGIVLLDSNNHGQTQLRYYFDIADTHAGRNPRPVPIWQVRPEYHQEIVEALENSFGALGKKDNFTDLKPGQLVTVVYYCDYTQEYHQLTGRVSKVDIYWKAVTIGNISIDFAELYQVEMIF